MIHHRLRFSALTLLTLFLVTGCNGGNGGGADPTSSPPDSKFDDGTMEMVLIPAGHFNMGGQKFDNEKPVHKVWIDAFVMDTTEVTNAAFDRITKGLAEPNPSQFKSLEGGNRRPIEQVKLDLVIRFCNVRSKLEGLEPCYHPDTGECAFAKTGYRLPTEAEWEYACRAGSETEYSFGDSAADLGDHAWFLDNSMKSTQPVAQKKANAWGLYDMHGNVAEWCHDVYLKDYYKSSPEKNPRGPTPSSQGDDLYVLRGGSWKSKAPMCRSAYRMGEESGFSDACLAKNAIGFRCVRKAP